MLTIKVQISGFFIVIFGSGGSVIVLHPLTSICVNVGLRFNNICTDTEEIFELPLNIILVRFGACRSIVLTSSSIISQQDSSSDSKVMKEILEFLITSVINEFRVGCNVLDKFKLTNCLCKKWQSLSPFKKFHDKSKLTRLLLSMENLKLSNSQCRKFNVCKFF